MSACDDLEEELEGLPEPLVQHVIAYVRRLKEAGGATPSEADLGRGWDSVLAREWLSPEEDEAWKDL